MKTSTAEQAVPKRRGRPPGRAAPHESLGSMPDREVAEKLGLQTNSVQAARSRAGIPAFDPTRAGKYVWTPENEQLLGTMSDGEIARRLGLRAVSVLQARNRRGIAAFRAPAKTPTVKEPKRRGRPPGSTGPRLAPEDATRPRSVRLTDARWEKLKRLGSEWLAGAIDRAKETA